MAVRLALRQIRSWFESPCVKLSYSFILYPVCVFFHLLVFSLILINLSLNKGPSSLFILYGLFTGQKELVFDPDLSLLDSAAYWLFSLVFEAHGLNSSNDSCISVTEPER